MDEETRKAIEKLIEEGFVKGDLSSHRKYHEEQEDKDLWHKKFFRKIVERAAMGVLTIIGSWALYALWVAFKVSVNS